MKTITVTIAIEDTKHTTGTTLAADIMDALINFKDANLAWSKIYSVTVDSIRCENTKEI